MTPKASGSDWSNGCGEDGVGSKTDRGITDVKAHRTSVAGIEFDDSARVEGKVVMAGATDRAEAVSATVEARSYFADKHNTGPRLGEDTDVARVQAGLGANQRLPLLADLVIAKVSFRHEAGLGIDREVFVDVVAKSPPKAVYGLAKALKVDSGVERAHLRLVLVSVPLGLRVRRGQRKKKQCENRERVSPMHAF